MIGGTARALNQLIPAPGQAAQFSYVCFVKRHQSGYELCRKLGISVDALWRFNPNIPDFESVWGGQVLLVPQPARPTPIPWEGSDHDFTLVPWNQRAEDFPDYPQKDDFLDPTWAPPASTELKAISNATRQALFGQFAYVDDPASGPDEIRITDGWDNTHIGMVQIHGLAGLTHGSMQFNKKCHKQLQGLWADWLRYDMRRHIFTFDGSFNPRFMRGAAHEAAYLSNHAWGTAFDINAKWNPYHAHPPHLGSHGSVMDLVEIADKWGFVWGGHFGAAHLDGMHFEVAKIL